MSIKLTPEPLKETEPAEDAENTEKSVNAAEISFFTWAKETDEATNLEDSVFDIEKCTVEKVAVAKGEAGKDFKTDTNTHMKQCPKMDLRWIWDVTSVENL